MPAKSEFAMKPEVAVLGLRDARRSDSIVCQGALRGASAAGRPSARVPGGKSIVSARGRGSENIKPGIGAVGASAKGQNSFSSGTSSGYSSRPVSAPYANHYQGGGPLGDITNVTSAQVDMLLPPNSLEKGAPPSYLPVPQALPLLPAHEIADAEDKCKPEKSFTLDELDQLIKHASVAACASIRRRYSEDSYARGVGAEEGQAASDWIRNFCMRHVSGERAAEISDQLKHRGGSLRCSVIDFKLPTAEDRYFALCLEVKKALDTTITEPPKITESPQTVDKTSNVQEAQEYVADIYDSMFREESVFAPSPHYMDTQIDITSKMRTILIDWLVEVHMKYRLRPETLHLTVNLIDRYLAKMPVMRKRLQLVGVGAMFIASKFEEINPPELQDWVYITDKAYTKEEVLQIECTMLTTISFQVMVPTAAHFFDGFQKANGCDDVHREVARYLLELTLLDVGMLQFTPSTLVAAALLLSNQVLKRCPVWPCPMVQHTRSTEAALQSCVDAIRTLLDSDRAASATKPGQLVAVNKKFATPERHYVSSVSFDLLARKMKLSSASFNLS